MTLAPITQTRFSQNLLNGFQNCLHFWIPREKLRGPNSFGANRYAQKIQLSRFHIRSSTSFTTDFFSKETIRENPGKDVTDFFEILHVAILLPVKNNPVDPISKFEVFVD